jgi:hypothetical protein
VVELQCDGEVGRLYSRLDACIHNFEGSLLSAEPLRSLSMRDVDLWIIDQAKACESLFFVTVDMSLRVMLLQTDDGRSQYIPQHPFFSLCRLFALF